MPSTEISRNVERTPLDVVVGDLNDLGVTEIWTFAWRDLDDPEAGGSEVHADQVMSRWAATGLTILHRTSRKGQPRRVVRNGYRVEHRGGRYSVFVRVVLRRLFGRVPRDVAVVEVWNGVPWFSPLWARGTRVTWMHHIHDEMWADSLPVLLAPFGRILESRVAPRFYRNTIIVTLADTTRRALIERGFAESMIRVVPPGVHQRFRITSRAKTTSPSVVAVGRLTPVKRFDVLISQFAEVLSAHPSAKLTIVGDGPDRPDLERHIARNGLAESVVLTGRLDDDALVDLYNRSWLLVSASHSEGWGMTITEAAACGTPAVVTDNHGHRAAVEHGVTGLIVADVGDLGAAISNLLADRGLIETMSSASHARSAKLTWDETALRTLEAVLDARRSQRV